MKKAVRAKPHGLINLCCALSFMLNGFCQFYRLQSGHFVHIPGRGRQKQFGQKINEQEGLAVDIFSTLG